MKLFRRSSTLRAAASNVSIEDVEGLLTTLGVIGALVLSVVLGVSNIPAEEMEFCDYRYAMLVLPSFRTYAVRVLELHKFNFEVKVPSISGGPDQTFDIKAAMSRPATDYAASLQTSGAGTVHDGPRNDMPSAFQDLVKAVDLSSKQFPMEYVGAFFAEVGDYAQDDPSWTPRETDDHVRLSSRLQNVVLACQIISALPLACSILLYLALVLSPIREMTVNAEAEAEKAEATKYVRRFTCVAMPLIVLNYIMIIISLFVIMGVNVQLARARSPSWEWAQQYKYIAFYVGVYPAYSVYALTFFFAFFFSGGDLRDIIPCLNKCCGDKPDDLIPVGTHARN